MQEDELEKAVHYCRQSLRLRQSPMAHWLLGRAYFLQEDYARAHGHFVFCLQAMGSALPVVLFDLALSCLHLFRFDDAEKYLHEYRRLEPEDDEADLLLAGMPRYREFRAGERMDDIRAEVYLRTGKVVLGTGTNGEEFEIEPALCHHFGLRATARVLGRLKAMLEAFGLKMDAIVSKGVEDLPVGIALAELLAVPLMDAADVRSGMRVLMACGAVRQPEPARQLRLAMETAGAQVIGFALGVCPDEEEGLPVLLDFDFVGVHGLSACFWFRVEPMSRFNFDRLAERKALEAGVEIPGHIRRGSKMNWLRRHLFYPPGQEGDEEEAGWDEILDPPRINPNVRAVANKIVREISRLEEDECLAPLLDYYLLRHRRLSIPVRPAQPESLS